MLTTLEYGITGRALKQKLLTLECFDPRAFTNDPHQTVDDRPYGGGPGMVMKVAPLLAAIAAAKLAANIAAPEQIPVICMSPQGKQVTQQLLLDFASKTSHAIFVAGRYEGIDERVYQLANTEEWSLGDYVLSGGELAVMVVIDALTRLLPGVLGCCYSAIQDSFMDGLLDCPHYTRPEEINGLRVPDVLLSGNHQAIRVWRLQQQLARTAARRPDLLQRKILTAEQQQILAQLDRDS